MSNGGSDCANCGRDYGLIEHHVSYTPEEVVSVCRPCHTKIHGNPSGFPELAPDRVPPERQRGMFLRNVRVPADLHDRLVAYMRIRGAGEPPEALEQLLDESGVAESDLEDELAAMLNEKAEGSLG